jgi:hypothetical protein
LPDAGQDLAELSSQRIVSAPNEKVLNPELLHPLGQCTTWLARLAKAPRLGRADRATRRPGTGDLRCCDVRGRYRSVPLVPPRAFRRPRHGGCSMPSMPRTLPNSISVKTSLRNRTESSAPGIQSNLASSTSVRVSSLQPRPRALQPLGRVQSPARQSLVVRRTEGELILDYPKPLEEATALRSTLITSSLTSLRERGLFERYDSLQTSPQRQLILNVVAGGWLPMEAGLAHYRACDALGLSEEEQIAIGKDVSKRVHETFLNLIVKAARGVGMTPWLLLPRGNDMQKQLCLGGGVRIWKVGPKSARVELAAMPQLAIPYVRHGLMGLYLGAVELLANNVTARIVKGESGDPAQLVVLRLDWA